MQLVSGSETDQNSQLVQQGAFQHWDEALPV